MESIESTLFYSALEAVDLTIYGCDCNGGVSWNQEPNESLAALVYASIDKPLSSPECLALQAAITEDQWVAYTEARKAPVRQQRNERYRNETDPLFMKAQEDGTSLDEWKTAKQKIRDELPYPE